MSPKTNITESQWLAALEKARPKPPPDGKTALEVGQIWGVSEKPALKYLLKLEEAGLYARTRIGIRVYWYPVKK